MKVIVVFSVYVQSIIHCVHCHFSLCCFVHTFLNIFKCIMHLYKVYAPVLYLNCVLILSWSLIYAENQYFDILMRIY
jgi:hypothetical protein